MKTLTGKFTTILAVVVTAACIAVVIMLSLLLLRRENLNLEKQGTSQSLLLVEAVTFAMNEGIIDVSPLEEALNDMEGILEFRLIPVEGLSSQPHSEPDEIEREILAGGGHRRLFQAWGEEGIRAFRVSEPLIARESCLMCHGGIEEGQAVAATSMFISTAESESSIRKFVIAAVLLTVLAAVSVLLLVWITLRIVVIRPIRRLKSIVIDIVEGEGDLTKRIQVKGKDEINDVAQWINQFIDQIHDIVQDIKKISSSNAQLSVSLSSSADITQEAVVEVKANIDEMQKLLGNMDEQSTNSAASVSQIFASITSLADRIKSQAAAVTEASAAIQEMSSSIDNMSRIADQKLESAKELKEITVEGGKKINEVNNLIGEISSQVDVIGNMIDIINGIAAQTNLLSMNAAIEAAHAGEYGRGFAVVAEEIRHLAESASSNASSITTTLKEIIRSINDSLGAAGESSSAFTRINTEVEEVVGAFEEIASSTRELAGGGREILQASSDLMQITEEIRNGSVEIEKGAEQVNVAQTAISEASGQSSTNINNVVSQTAEITGSIDTISSLSGEGRELGSRLDNAVKKFKVRDDGESTEEA